MKMVQASFECESKLNLYTADSRPIIDQFGRGPFFELLAQAFGSKDLTQVIGGDSFQKLMEQGRISADDGLKYFVLPRAGAQLDTERMKAFSSFVQLSETSDEEELSSTKIRNAIRSGGSVPADWVPAKVLEIIRENRLYKE